MRGLPGSRRASVWPRRQGSLWLRYCRNSICCFVSIYAVPFAENKDLDTTPLFNEMAPARIGHNVCRNVDTQTAQAESTTLICCVNETVSAETSWNRVFPNGTADAPGDIRNLGKRYIALVDAE